MTAEIELVLVNEFLCKVSCSTCFFQGQRWHCAYKSDIWPLLSTNPLQILGINQKGGVAISFVYKGPFAHFPPQTRILVSNREKTFWGEFFEKITKNRSLWKFKANPKRTKAKQSEQSEPKSEPKAKQSEQSEPQSEPKAKQSEQSEPFHHFLGYF